MSMGSGGVFGRAPFNPLAVLLGQQAAMPAADEFLDPETGENTIVVDGSNRQPPVATPPVYGEVPERPKIDPRYVLNDDRIAPSEEDIREIIPRKGMFGVKGTLRDVLGMLGDAFLVQSGNKAVYQPHRAEERKADAIFGLSGDPMQAAERLAAAGFADEAAAMFTKAAEADYRNRSLESQEAARKDLASDRKYTNVNQARTALQRIIAQGRTPEQRARLLARYGPLITGAAGATLEQLGLTPDLADEDLQAWARGDMTVNQNVTLPLAQERVDIARDTFEAKKDGGMFHRPPPRPGPQPRSQTELEYFQEIDRIPPAKRTQGQKDFYKKYTRGTRGSRLDGIAPPPPSGNNRLRIRNVRSQ